MKLPLASRQRWTMLTFAFLATAVNYLDRQALSVAAPLLRIQFHMSDIGYSRILFVFLFAYTVMNGLSGLIVDSLGTRLGYALFVGWWSISSLLQSFAESTLSLGAFRFLLGLGEAGNWPAATKLVAEWFPTEERSLASGLFNSGSAFGAILAPPLIALLVLRCGWRASFACVSLLGFLWLLGWLLFSVPPPKADSHPGCSDRLSLRSMVTSRFTLTFTVSKVFIDPVWYFYTFWFPEYLVIGRHETLSYVGHYAWLPFLVAGGGECCRRASVEGPASFSSIPHQREEDCCYTRLRVDGNGDPGGSRQLCHVMYCIHFNRHGRLHRGIGQYASHARRRAPFRQRCIGLRRSQYGLWIRRHDFYVGHGLAYPAVFLQLGISIIRRVASSWRCCAVGLYGPFKSSGHFTSKGDFDFFMNQGTFLKGMTALVTGASSGIGAATALALASEGANIVLHFNSNPEGAGSVLEQILQKGVQATLIQANLTTREGIRLLSRHVETKQIDILINNAGSLIARTPVLGFTEELWDCVMTLNLTSAFFLSQAVLRGMKERQHGVIVNVSSVAARNGGGIGALAYATAKAALSTMTRGLTREFASSGIRINAVSPGTIHTNYHKTFSTPEALEEVRSSTPAGRIGTPAEIADTIVFLCGPQARFIHGQVIEVNGGFLMP